MKIHITVVKNGFKIEAQHDGYAGWDEYVAEDERSLLDTISKLWRNYKNDTARRKHNENA